MTTNALLRTPAADEQPDTLALRHARIELDRATRLALAGELVGAITHDLRQPLTAVELNVSAALHLLRREQPRIDEAIAALTDAQAQQRRMSDAVQVLQDLAVRRDPFLEQVDPVTIVRDVVRLVSTDAIARNTPILLEIIPPVPRIFGEAVLMRQALLNILIDALEATALSKQRGAPVRVLMRANAGAVEVSVWHYGARAESSQIEQWGLAVARSVAGSHNATIVIEGDGDSGVQVVTRWPIVTPTALSAPSDRQIMPEIATEVD